MFVKFIKNGTSYIFVKVALTGRLLKLFRGILRVSLDAQNSSQHS